MLDLRSDCRLDVVHDVVQVGMGWTNSHLHQFSKGGELYLDPFTVDEGDVDGVPESDVRLDEVLADPGEALGYQYDFGDDWTHTITLLEVLPLRAPVAVCVDGAKACPPEDCGGIPGYQDAVAAVADRNSADPHLLNWLGDWDPDRFDVDEINTGLARWATLPDGLRSLADPGFGLPAPVADLVRRVRQPDVQWTLVELARGAALDEEPTVAVEVAAAMVRPYQWLLDRVGPDGLAATANGYLKPLDVLACATELDLDAGSASSTARIRPLPCWT